MDFLHKQKHFSFMYFLYSMIGNKPRKLNSRKPMIKNDNWVHSFWIPKYLWEELLIDKLIYSCVRNYSLTGLFFEAFFICISLYGKKWDKKTMDNQEDSTIKTIEPCRSFVEVHKFLMVWTSQLWVIILLRGSLQPLWCSTVYMCSSFWLLGVESRYFFQEFKSKR